MKTKKFRYKNRVKDTVKKYITIIVILFLSYISYEYIDEEELPSIINFIEIFFLTVAIFIAWAILTVTYLLNYVLMIFLFGVYQGIGQANDDFIRIAVITVIVAIISHYIEKLFLSKLTQ